MAWDNSTRNTKNPPGWAKTRKRIFARDHGICYVCGEPGADEIDHKLAIELGGTHADANLAAIHSVPCHRRKTAADAAQGRARRPRVTRRRPRERHPGLI